MRLAAYAGASALLAVGVILRAFHERPNFYSACVYLAQSNACRMILLNLFLLSTCAFLFGLQRLLYGKLRAVEIEQLWDKAWYAITETALAMTIFRDEVGVWFFIMFMSLLAGKVWAWIGEGRVDILEQQPPANPRLFHTRLVASLLLSIAFDLLMLRYCARTLLEQPRPGMMVMFAFEFAVLAITSGSTAARYALSLEEFIIIQKQTKAKLRERREEVRIAREAAQQQAQSSGTATPADLPREEDIDENDIDVPGWQEKGRWVLFLDLATDFLKLVVYIGFFTILLVFHSIPIHIIRDVFITARSFLKRIHDFLKYRNATKDMHSRYPDATAEDLGRDSTCIVCREEMQVWQPPDMPAAVPADGQRPTRTPVDERQRPKKLPCGHILHFGCLRSWLERQQVCPTCRRSVLAEPINQDAQNNPGRGGAGGEQQAGARGNQNADARLRGAGGARNRGQNNGAARTFRLGSYRVTLAAGNAQQVQNALDQARQQGFGTTEGRLAGSSDRDRGRNAPHSGFQDRLATIERQIMGEINNLNAAQEQLVAVRALQGELARLRINQANMNRLSENGQLQTSTQPNAPQGRFVPVPSPNFPMTVNHPHNATIPFQQQAYWNRHQEAPLDHDHPNLPAGLTLPAGWTLLPLERVPAHTMEMPHIHHVQSAGPIEVLPQIEVPGLGTSEPQPSRSGPAASPSSNVTAESHVPDTPLQTAPEPASGDLTTDTNAMDDPQQNAGIHTAGNASLPDWSNKTANDDVVADEVGRGEGASRDKGKGRAVTNEDTPGDEHGSPA